MNMEKSTLPAFAIAVPTFLVISIAYYSLFKSSTSEPKSNEDDSIGYGHLKPYTRFSHPGKFLIDKIISFIVELYFSSYDLPQYSNCVGKGKGKEDKNKMLAAVQLLRKKYDGPLVGGHTMYCKDLNGLIKKKTNGTLCLMKGTVTVPRNTNILSELGFPTNGNDKDEEGDVEISIMCPSSAIINRDVIKIEQMSGKEDDGQLIFPKGTKLCELNFLPTAQILIWYHGGGFMLGNARDAQIAEYSKEFTTMAKHDDDENNNNEIKEQPLVVLSVQYRLSPEHPFPAAVVDCLSVTFAVLKTIPNNSIHIGGQSAGANLAYVTTFEAIQNCPGRISSSLIFDPFILPQSNTKSYHMNSKSSYVSADFLKFFWRAYLQLDGKDTTTATATNDIYKDLQRNGWIKNSSGSGSDHPLWRLCCPSSDLPLTAANDSSSEKKESNNMTKFIVTTGSGDPLEHEGRNLVEYLKIEKQNLIHIEGVGSHVLWSNYDRKARKEFLQTWHDSIWGS